MDDVDIKEALKDIMGEKPFKYSEKALKRMGGLIINPKSSTDKKDAFERVYGILDKVQYWAAIYVGMTQKLRDQLDAANADSNMARKKHSLLKNKIKEFETSSVALDQVPKPELSRFQNKPGEEGFSKEVAETFLSGNISEHTYQLISEYDVLHRRSVKDQDAVKVAKEYGIEIFKDNEFDNRLWFIRGLMEIWCEVKHMEHKAIPYSSSSKFTKFVVIALSEPRTALGEKKRLNLDAVRHNIKHVRNHLPELIQRI